MSRPQNHLHTAHGNAQALFSTTFFTYGDEGWKTSKKLWVYWAVTIPSTFLVLSVYLCFANQRVRDFFAWLLSVLERKRTERQDSEAAQASM